MTLNTTRVHSAAPPYRLISYRSSVTSIDSHLEISWLATIDVAQLELTEAPDRQGIITDEKFKKQLNARRANYIAVLKRMH